LSGQAVTKQTDRINLFVKSKTKTKEEKHDFKSCC